MINFNRKNESVVYDKTDIVLFSDIFCWDVNDILSKLWEPKNINNEQTWEVIYLHDILS